MIFFAEKIALNVSGKFHTWIERLENKTQISFITCDCPVINLTGMEMGERHEFYYPLSPKVAMKLCSCKKYGENRFEKNKSIEISDESEIKKLNDRVFDEAYKEVFSSDEALLKKYM